MNDKSLSWQWQDKEGIVCLLDAGGQYRLYCRVCDYFLTNVRPYNLLLTIGEAKQNKVRFKAHIRRRKHIYRYTLCQLTCGN